MLLVKDEGVDHVALLPALGLQGPVLLEDPSHIGEADAFRRWELALVVSHTRRSPIAPGPKKMEIWGEGVGDSGLIDDGVGCGGVKKVGGK